MNTHNWISRKLSSIRFLNGHGKNEQRTDARERALCHTVLQSSMQREKEIRDVRRRLEGKINRRYISTCRQNYLEWLAAKYAVLRLHSHPSGVLQLRGQRSLHRLVYGNVDVRFPTFRVVAISHDNFLRPTCDVANNMRSSVLCELLRPMAK